MYNYALIGVLVGVLAILIPIYINRKKSKNKYFEIIWKPSSKLTPEDILNLRGFESNGFNAYYYERDIDDLIINKFKNNENILIIGNPISGKSRAVYELLKNFEEKVNVLIPRIQDTSFEDFSIPKIRSLTTRKVAIYNDIDKYASKQNFKYQLEELIKRDIQVIATCQTGNEFEILKSILDKDFSTIFGEPIEIKDITKDTASMISKEVNMELPDRFDGNLGSIFVALDQMRVRYANLADTDKQILINTKFLYITGIYNEKSHFSKDKIKLLCKHNSEFELGKYEWDDAFKRLSGLSLIKEQKDIVICDDVYFNKVIEIDLDIIECLKKAVKIFSEDFDSLIKISNRSYELGLIVEKRNFIKISINALSAALEIRTKHNFPMDYAMTQNGLGALYGTLAKVEDI